MYNADCVCEIGCERWREDGIYSIGVLGNTKVQKSQDPQASLGLDGDGEAEEEEHPLPTNIPGL